VYNSSKGAVIVMSKSMAAEFGPDRIRVNCVNPVFSPDTSLSAEFAGGALTEEAKKRFLATVPLGRFSTPRTWRTRASISPRTRPGSSAACVSKSTARAASSAPLLSPGS
jgi:NAD(P)-dependent dehydrogenase (short-subunit alcohol dehydrogenase family)